MSVLLTLLVNGTGVSPIGDTASTVSAAPDERQPQMTQPAPDPFEAATDKLILTYQAMLEHAGRPNGNVRVRDFGTLVNALGDCMQAFSQELSSTSRNLRETQAALLEMKAAVLELEDRPLGEPGGAAPPGYQ